MNARELRAQRISILQEAIGLVEAAEAENRNLTAKEQEQHDLTMQQADELLQRAERLESLNKIHPNIEPGERVSKPLKEESTTVFNIAPKEKTVVEVMLQSRSAPIVLNWPSDIKKKNPSGALMCRYLKTGDEAVARDMHAIEMEQRASNDTTMNITTNVDGQYLVPTGHYNQVIAKRDESMLANILGVRKITGQGTTVNVPIDNEDDGEFVVTSESGEFDRDAPATTYKAMTLAMYTKRIDLTYQLLQDEDSQLMNFLANFVGRGLAKTHNSLLLTEVAANGTALKTFASATAIAVDELEPIVYNEPLGNYLDDTGSVAWVMRRNVHGEIILLDDSSIRRYDSNALGAGSGPNLLGYPIKYSSKSGETAASTKSLYFGNWYYVGLREAPEMTMLRDPYTRSSYGEVRLNYYFRAIYGVLQAEAIGYGVHPSA